MGGRSRSFKTEGDPGLWPVKIPGTRPGVWLIYSVTHHLKKLIFPLQSGINCKYHPMIRPRTLCPPLPLSAGALSGLNFCRSSARCHSLLGFMCISSTVSVRCGFLGVICHLYFLQSVHLCSA